MEGSQITLITSLVKIMGILSIISYTFEGIDHQRKDFLQGIIKRYQPIFLCLQETWLLDSNSHVLNDVSSQYKPFLYQVSTSKTKFSQAACQGTLLSWLIQMLFLKWNPPYYQVDGYVLWNVCTMGEMWLLHLFICHVINNQTIFLMNTLKSSMT